MEQTVTANITGYHMMVTPLDEGYSDRMIEIYAEVSDSQGNVIGVVETDFFDTARNLPLALVKAYQIERKLKKGTLELSAF
jgi:hypothetical protein